MKTLLKLWLTLSISPILFSSCGGANTSEANTAAPVEIYTPKPAASPFGVGPIQEEIVLADLSAELATEGEGVFTTNCTACHKMDKRHVGPALGGVTQRRNGAWIMNMILNPEKMVQEDPTAKALLAEYLAPMANQSMTEDQAKAILAYFYKYDTDHP